MQSFLHHKQGLIEPSQAQNLHIRLCADTSIISFSSWRTVRRQWVLPAWPKIVVWNSKHFNSIWNSIFWNSWKIPRANKNFVPCDFAHRIFGWVETFQKCNNSWILSKLSQEFQFLLPKMWEFCNFWSNEKQPMLFWNSKMLLWGGWWGGGEIKIVP